MNGIAPTPKMAVTGLSGAIAVVVLYLLRQYAHFDPPSEVAGAITVILGFAGGYFTPRGPQTSDQTSLKP